MIPSDEWIAESRKRRGVVAGLLPLSELPKTRLELRWEPMPRDADGYDCRCNYELVLELDQYDIRGEKYIDGELVTRRREMRVSLGGCRSTGSDRSRVDTEAGTIETPYRDGAHIRWDARRLGLPAFVVADAWAMRILPGDPDQ